MKQLLQTGKKIIPTNIHGMLDYFFAFLLIALPTIGRFANNKLATVFFIAMGAIMIISSLFTKYEQGSFNVLSMKQHLKIDMGVAGVVLVSPFVLGFWDDVFIPNIILAIMMVTTALMSKEEVEVKEQERPMRIKVSRPRTKDELYRLYGNSVARNRK